jgi:hypothetical protein
MGDRKIVPESEEERLLKVKTYQARMIMDTSIELSYQLFDEIAARGINIGESPDIEQDMLMVCESIKATMLKACGITHPLHVLTEEIIQQPDGEKFRDIWVSLRETMDNDPLG